MRRWGIVVVFTAMVAVLAFGMTACGGSVAKGPVYLKTKQVTYDISSGEIATDENWTYDSRGNEVKFYGTTKQNGSEVAVEHEFSDFDQDGYPGVQITKVNSNNEEVAYEYARENGRVVSRSKNNGTESYSYHDNGIMKSCVLAGTNSSGNEYTIEDEYDEDGYLIKQNTSSDNTSRTLMWTKDSNGTPTDYTLNVTASGKSKTPVKFTVQCDDNGNIVRVYTAFGKLYKEYEYTKIDSPSTWAWLEGHRING